MNTVSSLVTEKSKFIEKCTEWHTDGRTCLSAQPDLIKMYMHTKYEDSMLHNYRERKLFRKGLCRDRQRDRRITKPWQYTSAICRGVKKPVHGNVIKSEKDDWRRYALSDRYKKLINSRVDYCLHFRNVSSKSVHNCVSYRVHRHTNNQTFKEKSMEHMYPQSSYWDIYHVLVFTWKFMWFYIYNHIHFHEKTSMW